MRRIFPLGFFGSGYRAAVAPNAAFAFGDRADRRDVPQILPALDLDDHTVADAHRGLVLPCKEFFPVPFEPDFYEFGQVSPQ